MRIHIVKGYISDLYIAEYPDRILVLDAGCAGDVDLLAGFVEETLGRPVGDIRLVISSHTHPDHAGGAARWRGKYGIPVAAPARMNHWYAGIGGFVQHKVDMMLAQWVSHVNRTPRKKVFYPRHTIIDLPLYSGFRLPLFPDWRVLAAPGHTAHDLVFYHVASQTLYAADVILNIKGKFLPPFPVVFPEAMKKTVGSLKKLPVKRLLLAHGGDIRISDFRPPLRQVYGSLHSVPNPMLKRLMKISRFSPDIRKSGFS